MFLSFNIDIVGLALLKKNFRVSSTYYIPTILTHTSCCLPKLIIINPLLSSPHFLAKSSGPICKNTLLHPNLLIGSIKGGGEGKTVLVGVFPCYIREGKNRVENFFKKKGGGGKGKVGVFAYSMNDRQVDNST